MAYWGIALANSPNHNSWAPTPSRLIASRDVIRTALGLLTKGPPSEQVYVNALAKCFISHIPAELDGSRLHCANAMRGLYHSYPDDS
jgi:hypothetical protein